MSALRSILRFDRAGIRPVGGILRLIGVAIPVLIAYRIDGRGPAVLAGLGALYAGMASYGGVHRARLKRMLAATTGAGLTTLIGCLVQPYDGWTILAATLVAFVVSLLAAAGPDAAMVATHAAAMLAVLSGVAESNLHPLGNALLVIAGGFTQAAVLHLFHPLSPVAAERRTVEAVYLGLARYARAKADGISDVPLPTVSTHATARTLLREGVGYGAKAEHERLWRALEMADTLRGNLVGLARAGAPAEIWSPIADWCEHATECVTRGRAITERLPEIETEEVSLRPWLSRIRRAIDAGEAGLLPTDAPRPRPWLLALKNVQALRALALGHALRYAITMGIAIAGYRLLKIDHGYWAALAVAFSLRPDFATTLTRGAGRIIGTAIGVACATAFVDLILPGPNGLIVGMLGAVWVTFALQNATYVGFSTGLAFYVVMSVTLSGMAVETVGLERLGATIAGSVLSILAAVLWPNFEAGRVRELLATAFATQAEYGDAVRRLSEDGTPEEASYARLRARASRLEAERVAAAAGLEPRWSREGRLDGASLALGRLAENAARILAAHAAAVDPHPQDTPGEDLRRIAAEDRALAADLMG